MWFDRRYSTSRSALSRRLWRIRAFAALGGLAQSLTGAAGALLVREIGGSDLVAGMPQAVLVLGAGAAAVVLSRVATRRGRCQSLMYGAAVAVLGCLVVIAGAVSGALPVVLLGTCLLGTGNAAVMLSRYAAPELNPTSSRPRAMASVLAATTIGAVVGPNLLGASAVIGRLANGPDLVGAYVVGAAVFLVAAFVVAGTLPSSGPDRLVRSTNATITTRLASGTWHAHAVVGLMVLSVANLVMVAVMTMAPMQMSHRGSGLGTIGLVVSAHIAAMFAPSVASGRLAERIGSERTAVVALALMTVACGYAAMVAQSPLRLGAAMFLLGIGWNLALLAGSDLLTRSVVPAERPHRESRGELGMAIAATAGGAGSGAVMAGGGYSSLAVVGATIAALALAALAVWHASEGVAAALPRAGSGHGTREPLWKEECKSPDRQ
jgi:MFS family permease